MAKVFGAAGEHAALQSVAAFRKMFLIMTIVIGALCFGEGVLATVLLTRTGSIPWWLLAVGLLSAICLASHVELKWVEDFEKRRLNYRAGFLGEHEVAMELEALSEKFTVFNNVNTKRGNLDHVVVGPTGLFAIETKNWTGLISAALDGELNTNGRKLAEPYVRKFLSRAMMVREQVSSLTRNDRVFVRAVMVFPKAHVDAPWGKTGKVHCLRLNRLRDYIENPEFSQKLSEEQTQQLVRALHGVAGMDINFAETTTAAVIRSITKCAAGPVAAASVR